MPLDYNCGCTRNRAWCAAVVPWCGVFACPRSNPVPPTDPKRPLGLDSDPARSGDGQFNLLKPVLWLNRNFPGRFSSFSVITAIAALRANGTFSRTRAIWHEISWYPAWTSEVSPNFRSLMQHPRRSQLETFLDQQLNHFPVKVKQVKDRILLRNFAIRSIEQSRFAQIPSHPSFLVAINNRSGKTYSSEFFYLQILQRSFSTCKCWSNCWPLEHSPQAQQWATTCGHSCNSSHCYYGYGPAVFQWVYSACTCEGCDWLLLSERQLAPPRWTLLWMKQFTYHTEEQKRL